MLVAGKVNLNSFFPLVIPVSSNSLFFNVDRSSVRRLVDKFNITGDICNYKNVVLKIKYL
jgi:hypothetical protein